MRAGSCPARGGAAAHGIRVPATRRRPASVARLSSCAPSPCGRGAQPGPLPSRSRRHSAPRARTRMPGPAARLLSAGLRLQRMVSSWTHGAPPGPETVTPAGPPYVRPPGLGRHEQMTANLKYLQPAPALPPATPQAFSEPLEWAGGGTPFRRGSPAPPGNARTAGSAPAERQSRR
jgi:hypothetical protein